MMNTHKWIRMSLWMLLSLWLLWEMAQSFLRGETPKVTPFTSSKVRIECISDDLGQGMVATDAVQAGEVLILDQPLINVKLELGLGVLQAMINYLQQPSNEVAKMAMITLHSSTVVEQALAASIDWYKKLDSEQQQYLAKMVTNEYNLFVYPTISKINHGFPTNVVLFPIDSGGKNQIAVVATNDIPAGTQIQYDYLQPLTKERYQVQNQLQTHQFKLSKKEWKLINLLTNQDVPLSAKQKKYHLMYANGIVSDGSSAFTGVKKSISNERYATLIKCLTNSAERSHLHTDCCGIVGKEFQDTGLMECP